MTLAATSIVLNVTGVELEGDLTLPQEQRGLVVFAHGSGSSRHSPRNRAVAQHLEQAGLGTLLFDLLTAEEEQADRADAHLRFDIELLGGRLVGVTDWLTQDDRVATRPIGLFGASTGAAAALVAAASRPERVSAVVSRGGRPDLAGDSLRDVAAPTLLIVGGDDAPVIEYNRDALGRLGDHCRMEIVPGASHLFEEPGTLERVSDLARDWFLGYLAGPETTLDYPPPVEKSEWPL